MRLPALAFLVVLGLWVPLGPVAASGWSASGLFRQSFRLTLEDGEDNETLPNSTTSLGVTFANQTPTTTFSVSPGVVLSVAERSNEDDDTIQFNPRLEASLTHAAPRLSLNAVASVIPTFRSDRQFDSVFDVDPDTGETELRTEERGVDPLEIVSSGSIGASYQIDNRNTANSRLFFRRIDYSGDSGTLEPSSTVGASAGLSRALDQRTTGSFTVSVRRFMSDGDEDDSDSVSFSFGGSRAVSSRLDANVDLGLTGVQDDDDFDVGFTGGLSGGYRFGDATIRAGLRQAVDQDDDGVVQSITAVNAGIDYPVNNRSSLGVSVGYTRSEPFSGQTDDSPTDTLTFGARYGFQLTADWGLNLSYGLRVQNEDGQETEVSNRFLLGFSRNLDLLP